MVLDAKMPSCPPVGLKERCIPDPRNAPCVLEAEGDGVTGTASEHHGAHVQTEQDLLVCRVTPVA